MRQHVVTGRHSGDQHVLWGDNLDSGGSTCTLGMNIYFGGSARILRDNKA